MRIVIFAAYDKLGIVREDVLTYLHYLKEIADRIIFISDNTASKGEEKKLHKLVDYAQFQPHGEHDFGS